MPAAQEVVEDNKGENKEEAPLVEIVQEEVVVEQKDVKKDEQSGMSWSWVVVGVGAIAVLGAVGWKLKEKYSD